MTASPGGAADCVKSPQANIHGVAIGSITWTLRPTNADTWDLKVAFHQCGSGASSPAPRPNYSNSGSGGIPIIIGPVGITDWNNDTCPYDVVATDEGATPPANYVGDPTIQVGSGYTMMLNPVHIEIWAGVLSLGLIASLFGVYVNSKKLSRLRKALDQLKNETRKA